MEVRIVETGAAAEPDVIIRCRQTDSSVRQLADFIRLFDSRLTGWTDQGTRLILLVSDILYFESVDGRTFAYTLKVG